MLITKRMLGWLAMAAGVLTIGGLVVYDLLRHHSIGQRLQLVALAIAVIAIVVGISLLPLKDHPV